MFSQNVAWFCSPKFINLDDISQHVRRIPNILERMKDNKTLAINISSELRQLNLEPELKLVYTKIYKLFALHLNKVSKCNAHLKIQLVKFLIL